MMTRLVRMIDAAAELLGSRAGLLLHDLGRLAAVSVVRLVGVLVCAAGLLVLGASLALVLAAQWGWPASLAICGGVITLIGGIVLVAAGGVGDKRMSREQLGERDAQARSRLRELADLDERVPGESASGAWRDAVDGAVKSIINNPEALAAGAFAVFSVLGPVRAIRLLSRATAAAGVAASALKAMNSMNRARSGDVSNGAEEEVAGPVHGGSGSHRPP